MHIGQAPDTAAMNFEPSRSIVWVIESLTAGPLGSSSIVHRDSPSAMNSGLYRFCQQITNRRGGSASTILPVSLTWPSGYTIFHADPAVQRLSLRTPNHH